MRILIVHNHYQWPGGEDQVFRAEAELLERHGHSVATHTVHNRTLDELGRVTLAGKTLWNRAAYREIRALCAEHRPQVVHFHNTFPLVSPAAYYAAKAEGAVVIQTLHNYRLLCPATTFYRSGRVCEDCLHRPVPWPGVLHACYRGSRIASMGVATLTASHRAVRTWTSAVDAYVALTNFARRKFIEGGLPANKLVCKPNFLSRDPGPGDHQGAFALFVGRLSDEKGVRRLLEAWARAGPRIALKIVGDGPLAPLLRAPPPGVEWLGQRTAEEVVQLMKEASFLIFPSEWYETFGLVIIEAFAAGLPVIASNLGAAAELVSHGETGLHFPPGDSERLASTIEWAIEHPSELAQMGRRGRLQYLERYTAERNYRMLLDIYRGAMEGGRAAAGGVQPPTSDSDSAPHSIVP